MEILSIIRLLTSEHPTTKYQKRSKGDCLGQNGQKAKLALDGLTLESYSSQQLLVS